MKKITGRTRQQEIPSLLERYELKYLIPVSLVDPISDYLSVYCSPDLYSQESEDGFYTITSLYLDSPHFLFLKNRLQSVDNRFNMRIRSYDSRSGIPCFFEIKQKRNGIVRKYRASVSDPHWPGLFETPGYELDPVAIGSNIVHVRLFYQTAWAYRAEPKVLTQYRRKAYISDVDGYARATFDRDLRYQEACGYQLIPDEKRLLAYDSAAVFDPECSVILELKCYASLVPLWMLDLIRYFNLQRGRFSKYVTSVIEALGLNRGSDLLDRFPS